MLAAILATTGRALSPLPAAWRGWSGTHNRDIESAEEIWAFLRQFRKGDVTP